MENRNVKELRQIAKIERLNIITRCEEKNY